MSEIAKVVYTNSEGKFFNLMVDDIRRIHTANFHRYSWNKETIELRYGERIAGWKKGPIEYEATIRFSGSDRAQLLNDFHAATETDILYSTPGKLKWEEYTIPCFIISSDTHPIEGDYGSTENTVIFYCPIPWWTKTTEKRFFDNTEQPIIDLIFDLNNYIAEVEIGEAFFNQIEQSPFDYYAKLIGFNPTTDGVILYTSREEDAESIRYIYTTPTQQSTQLLDARIIILYNKINDEYLFRIEANSGSVDPYLKNITMKMFCFESGMDYNYDYPYNYSSPSVPVLYNDSEYGSSFILTINGPANNPSIRFGETYVKVNVEVKAGEYLIVNSVDKTVLLITDDSVVNCFGNRDTENDNYIFRKIDPGSNLVTFENVSQFNMELLDERSEPKWTI